MSLPWHLQQWTRGENFQERHLDCGNCSQAEFDWKHAKRWSNYKCCTFQPYVANYNCVEARSNKNCVFLPIGAIATKAYQDRYHKTDEVLKGESLLCSNYDLLLRQCSMWAARPAECATFHCQSRHPQGIQFWQEKSHEYFQIEVAVAQMTMLEMGFEHQEIAEQITWIHAPKNWNESQLRQAWAHWFGREQEYFQKCRAWASQVQREQVAEWLSS